MAENNDNKVKTRWTKERLDRATVLIYLFGAVVAVCALVVYIFQTVELSKQNKIQIDLSLRQAENAMYDTTSRDPFLMAFFADPPEKEDFSIADAENYVNIVLEKNSTFGGWKNVEEFLSKLYAASSDYYDPKKQKLRKAYDLAERVLYLLQDAHSAHQAGILGDEDYETWITYVDDLGFNPFFLSALYYGHSSGYITKKFAEDIKKRFIRTKRNEQAARILYEELLKPDWKDNVGKRGYDNRMKTGINSSSRRIAAKPDPG